MKQTSMKTKKLTVPYKVTEVNQYILFELCLTNYFLLKIWFRTVSFLYPYYIIHSLYPTLSFCYILLHYLVYYSNYFTLDFTEHSYF